MTRVHIVVGWCRNLLALGLALSVVACGEGPSLTKSPEARQLVERYNDVISEAFSRGDAKRIEPVALPSLQKRLAGLIEARLAAGITLDAQMLSQEMTQLAQAFGIMRIQTKERWRYRDRRIGSGEQVGEESLGSFDLLYIFKYVDNAWRVEQVEALTTPQGPRPVPPWVPDVHGEIAIAIPTMQHDVATPTPVAEQGATPTEEAAQGAAIPTAEVEAEIATPTPEAEKTGTQP